MSYSWLPAVLAEIAEAAGVEAALKLAEQRGGTRIAIPAYVRDDDHWLVRCVGRTAAEKICAHYRQLSSSDLPRGVRIELPLGPAGTIKSAQRRLVRALEDKKTAAEAARVAGMTERTAWRAKARLRGDDDDPNQGKLFDPD